MRELIEVDPSLYKAKKNERKQARRRLRENKRLSEAKVHDETLARTFGRKSQIVAMLSHASIGQTNLRKRGFGLLLPSVFSMLESPEQSLACLADFARATLSERLGSVSINYAKVTQQDLGANALLDIIVDELSTHSQG